MKIVYIFGVGKGKDIVRQCLKKSVCIKGYLDNDIHQQGKKINGIKVVGIEQIKREKRGFIIVSVMNQYREIYIQLVESGINKDRIVLFFDPNAVQNPEFEKIINIRKWKMQHLKYAMKGKYRKLLGSWSDIFSELDSIHYGKHKKSIAVIGTNKYSKYFAKKARQYIPKYKGEVYAFNNNRVPKNFGLPVREFDELLYLDTENLVVYIIEPVNVKKIMGDLLEMGIKKENVKILGECQSSGTRLQDVYDIHLGYSWIENKLPGFVVFRSGQNIKRPFRIVTLGGSTSDPTLVNIKSWPEILYEKIKKMGINVEVYAGGMGAYVSSQELQKFIRDAIVLKPDLVISYSGINDAYDYYHEPGHPFVLFYQAELLKKMVKMQIRNLLMDKKKITGYTYGLIDKSKTWEHWLYCERIMHTVSKEYGIRFYTFLQPYNRNTDINYIPEKSWSDIEQFYCGVKKYITSNPDSQEWLKDFTAIFDTQENVFFDHCHVYEKGNRIIAGRMMPYVLRAIEEVKNCGYIGNIGPIS